jgi:23S rRNA (guanine745-N1)-methyltransferase
LPLVAGDSRFACAAGHAFDRAREGYVNLARTGRKRSRPAGDDAEMLRARRAFLDRGHYAPVIDAVADAIAATHPSSLLESGCGEGTFLAAATVTAAAAGRGPISAWGIDIAKPAVALAARRHTGATFAVASAFDLPFDDQVFDVALSVFAPRAYEELTRVARIVVTASPGPNHLDGVRRLVYAAPRPHQPRLLASDADRRVRFTLSLDDPDEVTNLLHMTPYWWQAPPSVRQSMPARLETTVDVVIATVQFAK